MSLIGAISLNQFVWGYSLRISTAFIFSSGLGTRLLPLTENVPKPLLPIISTYSALEITIICLLKLGITDIFINFSYAEQQFKNIQQKYKNKANILLIEDRYRVGHGGILLKAKSLIKSYPILCINGDTIIDLSSVSILNLNLNESYIFYCNKQISLPKCLISNASGHLVGVFYKSNILKYSEEYKYLSFINNLGLYLISKDIMDTKLKDKGFIGLFDHNSLMHKYITSGGTVNCVILDNLKYYATFNTSEEYYSTKKYLRTVLAIH